MLSHISVQHNLFKSLSMTKLNCLYGKRGTTHHRRISVCPSFRKHCCGKLRKLVRQEHLPVFANLCLLSATTLLSSGNVTSLSVIVSSGTWLLRTPDLPVVSAQRRFLISLIEKNVKNREIILNFDKDMIS